MIKKTIKYTDYNGIERTENFYFHLTKAEVMEMEMSTAGGLAERIQRIVDAQDAVEIIKIFKELVLKSYGEKSDDGRRFIKSPEISKAFSENPAYSEIFMELATDADKAAEFVNGIVPAEAKQELQAQQANRGN